MRSNAMKLNADDDCARSPGYTATTLVSFRKRAEADARQQAQSTKTPDEKKKLKTVDQLVQDNIKDMMSNADPGVDDGPPTPENFRNWLINRYLLKEKRELFSENANLDLLGEQVMKQLPVNPLSEEFAKKMYTQDVRGRYIFIAAKSLTPAGLKEAQDSTNAAYDKVLKDPKSFSDVTKTSATRHAARRRLSDSQWVKAGDAMSAEYGRVQLFALAPGRSGQPVRFP